MKSFYYILIFLCFCSSLYSQNITERDVRQVAILYKQIRNSVQGKSIDIDTSTCVKEMFLKNNIYVVNYNRGWALVPNTTSVTPILAFSEDGQFPTNEEDLPDGVRELIKYYEHVVNYAIDSVQITHLEWQHFLDSTHLRVPSSDVILSRMQEIQWGQDNNNDGTCVPTYNQQCPNFYPTSICNARNLVGCGAVAMGQLMWYWQWPHSAIVPLHMIDTLGTTSGSVIHTYNWDQMPATLHSTTNTIQINELTSFLRDCGFSIHTTYRYDGSYSFFTTIYSVLNETFGYSSGYMTFANNNSSLLIPRLKAEINNGRPALMRGANSLDYGGHFFVVYGYTSDDKFYINWGWRGLYNNTAFSVDNLTPGYHDYSFFRYLLVDAHPEPLCHDTIYNSSITTGNIFNYVSGGDVTLQDMTIESGANGVVLSGTEVELTHGVNIQTGAEVLIDIKDIPCNN